MARHVVRRVITISAEDTPNVQYARYQQAAGLVPTNEIVLPGVLPWSMYQARRRIWDPVRQCVGLDGVFFEGAQTMLYPSLWLTLAELAARPLWRKARKAKTIGVDTAEGGDNTCMAACDDTSLIELVSEKTPDTAVICDNVVAFMRRHGVEPHNVLFDAGGGGKQHADRLRARGFRVRTVAFGEAVSQELRRGLNPLDLRKEVREDRYVFVNRRSQMYGEFSILLDPMEKGVPFALPGAWAGPQYAELHRQLSLIPRTYDNESEGRLKLIPKDKPSPNYKGPTLKSLLGCSPDEADAVVLAVHGLLHKGTRTKAGVA